MSKPLVTLTVICYNASKFVKEAIEGALSQTYSPLEIIFSDDNSPDGTFEIIKETVKDYTGPHKIVLNKNETNLGIGAHVAKVWYTIAKGEWIAVSAGDDVSLPNRIERLMEVATPETAAIHHNYTRIDDKRNPLPDLNEFGPKLRALETDSIETIIKKGHWLIGSTMCFRVAMLKQFKPFVAGLVNEDVVLAYRARHFGKVIYLDEKLFLYRIHEGSVSHIPYKYERNRYKTMTARRAKQKIAVMNQILADNEVLKLSDSFINDINNEKLGHQIDYCVFSVGKFRVNFLADKRFYIALAKRMFKRKIEAHH